MSLTDLLDPTRAEVARVITICNACRYCEGHCAVFPAMERRLDFAAADVDYLANLCHNCGACYHHCQYADPHAFDVNVPRAMAALRTETYGDYAWPSALKPAFRHGGMVAAAAIGLACIAFIVGFALLSSGFGGAHANAFYGVMPHNAMAGVFSVAALFTVVALGAGVVRCWRGFGLPSPARSDVLGAIHDAFTLRYLDGGAGDGCTYPDERPSQARRVFHHLTFYGFLACFAATSVGTFYHYGLGWAAPYGYVSLPKLFGVPGGIAMMVGTVGLLWLSRKADEKPRDQTATAMNQAFIVFMFLTAATGIALMLVKTTALVGPALAIHLGVVMAFFITAPYGKFVHGFYRLIALIAHHFERRQGAALARR